MRMVVVLVDDDEPPYIEMTLEAVSDSTPPPDLTVSLTLIWREATGTHHTGEESRTFLAFSQPLTHPLLQHRGQTIKKVCTACHSLVRESTHTCCDAIS